MRALLLTALLALPLTAPGAADAATVGVQGPVLTVTAASGERNRLALTRSGTSVRVTDRVTTRAGAGCRQSGAAVLCPAAGLTDLAVDAGDQPDRVEVSRALTLRTRLRGGAGDDLLVGGGGPDELDGGAGRDTVSYAARPDAVAVTLAGGADDGAPGEGDQLAAIEVVLGTAGADTLAGGAGADRLEGRAGEDRLDGGGGNDTLVGGGERDALAGGDGDDLLLASAGPDGTDAFAGGGGTDRVDYGPRAAGVVADPDGRADDGERPGGILSAVGLVPAIALLAAPEGDNVLPDVESLRGGRGDDVLAAGAAGGTIEGMAGTDVVGGGPGADRLSGGVGFDRLLARDGRADALDCGTQTDRAFVDGADRVPASCEQSSTSFVVMLAPAQRTLTAAHTLGARVTCPAQAARRCVGAVRIVTVRRLRDAAGRSRAATLGAARFNAPAGATVEVTVALDAAARTTLTRLGGTTRVRLAARGRDEAGPARPTAARFILRAP